MQRMFAEVTQVRRFLSLPYSRNGKSRSLTRCMRLSGVKVPRPASPFMTHETTLGVEMAVAVSRGTGRKNETGNSKYFVVV
jgi:hypothetical protein